MTRKIFTLLFICIGTSLLAQEFSAKSKTDIYTLVSDQNYEYEIVVTVPPRYDSSKTYKTLYYLDAWWLTDVVKGNYIILNRTNLVEDLILVGISIDGSSDEFTKQRTRDYTPMPYNMKFPFVLPLEQGSLIVDSNNSGRANAFRAFLKTKVFPLVSREYKVDNDDKGFIGHSFGGLFGIYDAMDEESFFQRHIIISPALWWNKSTLLYEKIEDNMMTHNTEADLFICYGETEGFLIVKQTDKLIDYFQSNDIQNLKYRFEIYNGEDHTSLLPESIYEGIEYFYKKEQP